MNYNQSKLIDNIQHSDFPFKIEYGILNEDFEEHSHDYHELFIITKGTAIHTINNNKQKVLAGDIFVINSTKTQHCFTNPIQLELYNFIYHPEYFCKNNNDLLQLEGYQSLFVVEPFFSSKTGYKNFVHLSYENLSEVIILSEIMLAEYKAKQPGYRTFIKSKFLELILKLSREYSKETAIKISRKFDGLGKAVAYIEKNFTRQIYIDELAEKAAFSPRQFLRLFKECYNTTPVNYIIQLRMKYAISLLKDSKLELKEIAYLCGFNDANYFSRKFSQRMGVSPTQYKQYL